MTAFRSSLLRLTAFLAFMMQSVSSIVDESSAKSKVAHTVARFLEQKFPGQVEVEGDFYPAPPAVELLSNLTNIIQLIAILWMVLGGENLLRMVGYKNGMPRWFSTVQENAFQIGVAIFLILPQVVAKWTLSGAFEVFLDGEQVWSKLEAGGFPTQDQLVSPLLEAGLTQQS